MKDIWQALRHFYAAVYSGMVDDGYVIQRKLSHKVKDASEDDKCTFVMLSSALADLAAGNVDGSRQALEIVREMLEGSGSRSRVYVRFRRK